MVTTPTFARRLPTEHPVSVPDADHQGLAIRLFGFFEVRYRGEPLPPLRTRKERWLLALLVLHEGQAVDRAWLAETLWPEARPRDALYNLRRSLSLLRAALGPEAERITAPTARALRLDLSNAWCDVVAFDSAMRSSDESVLEIAIGLYIGPLLASSSEEWVLPEREARDRLVLSKLELLAERARERGDFACAIDRLRRVLGIDPMHETAVRSLMAILRIQRCHSGANAVFRELRTRLRNELNLEPSPATIALSRQIQTEAKALAVATPAMTVSESPASSSEPVASPAAHTVHLPIPQFGLIGRTAECEAILSELDASRLVTLTGPGGIGKTRLSIAVANALVPEFPDGVYFVDFAAITEAARLPYAVLDALGQTEQAKRSPNDVLAEFLHAKRVLFIIDNCEQLKADCARLAQSLLRKCTGLRLLATSREPLRAFSETPISLSGLAPEASLRLFLERAERAGGTFHRTPATESAAGRICARVDHLPLAIEMAAAWTRTMTAAQIADRLDDAFRFVKYPDDCREPRHRTLWATLDWSYRLLTCAEQALLARLSVFAAGWTIDAAEAVCSSLDLGVAEEDVLDLLISLADKSLIVRSKDDEDKERYRFLETTRVYAAELLPNEDRLMLTDRMAAYLLTLSETAKRYWGSPEERAWLDRLDLEMPNIRIALARSSSLAMGEEFRPQPIASQENETRLRLAGGLMRLWWKRAHLTEGRQFLATALDERGQNAPADVRAVALNALGVLANMQRDREASLRAHSMALALRREIGDARGTAVSLFNLGYVYSGHCEWRAALDALSESAEIYRSIGDEARATKCFQLIEDINWESRPGFAVPDGASPEMIQSEASISQSLEFSVQSGDRQTEAEIASRLGQMVLRRGNFAEADACYRRSLRLYQGLGDTVLIVAVLESWAALRTSSGFPGDLPRLYGAAERRREEINCPMLVANRAVYQQNIAEGQATLGKETFEALRTTGRAMTLDAAVAYILAAETLPQST